MGAGVSVPRINERFMGMRPEGYLSPEDQSFLDRTLASGTENIGAGVTESQGLAAARLRQRRVGGAAAEDVLGGIAGQGGLARARLGASVGNLGYNIFQGNKRFAQQGVMKAWDAELGARARYDQRRQAQHAAWANAVGSLAGIVGQSFGGGMKAGTSIEGSNDPYANDFIGPLPTGPTY